MGARIEIEFTSGVWTDVTQYAQLPIELQFGVRSWDDDGQAGQIVFTLENYDGRFNTDNPLSPYWDIPPEGLAVRYSIEHNSVSYPRGVFRVKTWALNTQRIMRFSTVTVTAMDALASLSRRPMDSDLIERYRYTTTTAGATWVDAWPLVEQGRPRRPHNVGFPERPSATMVDPPRGRGGCAYASADPLVVEGSITTAPNTFLGPVLLCNTQASPAAPLRSVTFWLRIPGAQAPLDDFAVLAAGWDKNNQCVFRFVVSNTVGGGQQLELHYGFDPGSDIGFGYVVDTAPNDNAWHSFYLQENVSTGTTAIFYDSGTSGEQAFVRSFVLTDVVNLVFGGDMRPSSPGGQKGRSVPMAVAGIMASDGKASGIEIYARGGQIVTAAQRFNDDYRRWAPFFGVYSGTTRNVVIASSIGRTITESIQELARTVTGLCWVRYRDNAVELLDGTFMRPRGVGLTLTVGEDDDAEPGQLWRRGALENPTRQTITSPMGDGTFVDNVAELKERRDGSSISTATVSPVASRALAAWYVRRGKRLRLETFGVDVTTAVQDIWNWVLTLIAPGQRIRLQGLEPEQFGYTYRDVFLLGWTETWDELENGEQSCRIVFTTVPADTPAESVYEDSATIYDRFDFNLQEATIGALTASATSATITSTGPPLTTDPADYPLWLNLSGETVRANTPPASSTSPQTVTIVRGQLGSVARAQNAGTYVQLYPLAGYGAG